MRLLWLAVFLALPLRAMGPLNETPHRRDFVIGLSPFLDKSVKDDVYRGIVRLLVQDLPLDSTLAIYDAYNLQSIAEVTLPDVRAFASPKTRANQFSGAVQNLKRFLAGDHPKPAGEHLNFTNSLRV